MVALDPGDEFFQLKQADDETLKFLRCGFHFGAGEGYSVGNAHLMGCVGVRWLLWWWV